MSHSLILSQPLFRFSSAVASAALSLWAIAPSPINAQITPDNTLVNPSITNTNDLSTVITGGTTNGSSLFHSFDEFSIPENGSAIFFNAPDIEQIFSRVTGSKQSNIDGLLGSRGTADLFFINPNGIIFGDRASLDIGGSLIASTAESIQFAEGFQFSAVNPESPPLLTINTPVGLQLGINPGAIQTQANSRSGSFNVANGQTLALIGNGLSFTNSTVFVDDGRIELGSIAPNQTVSLTALTPGWQLGYDAVTVFNDITLTDATTIDTAGDRGGSIQVYGRILTVAGGSQIFSVGRVADPIGSIVVRTSEAVEIVGVDANNPKTPSGIFLEVEGETTGRQSQLLIETARLRVMDGGTISTNTLGQGRGATLKVNAREQIELQANAGRSTGLFSQVQRLDDRTPITTPTVGDGGNIILQTPLLTAIDGARISTTTQSEGNAGSITIRAEHIRLGGFGMDDNGRSIISAIAATTENSVTGNGGPITIQTHTLMLSDGAQIITSTRGSGNGDTLEITARDSITLTGAAPDATPNIGRSGLFVASERQGTGDTGSLVVRSPLLQLLDRAEISANTFRQGNSDQVEIAVDQLIANDGSQIRANSFRFGEGGDIRIQGYSGRTVDRIQLSGTGTIRTQVLASGIASRVPRANANANAGQVSIEGDRIIVDNSAAISVNNVGTGQAGQLQVRANRLDLSQGIITASTRSGGGADINLAIANLLTLNRNSNITAQAFERGNGGNITISTPQGFITALPDQDSNIVAKAEAGNGGDINITAQTIFGLDARPEVPITNDIDASSEFGLDGTVTINRIAIDPSRGLVVLPSGVVDVSGLVAQQCGTGNAIARQQGEFTITGRGGVPPSPSEFAGPNIWEDRRLIVPLSSMQSSIADSSEPSEDWREISMQNLDTNFRTGLFPGPLSPISQEPAPYQRVTEAQGWTQDATGTVHLIATSLPTTQTANRYSPWQPQLSCSAS